MSHNRKSAIWGTGFGTKHHWEWQQTDVYVDPKVNHYQCAVCGVEFAHYRGQSPTIYDAMREGGIPEECEPPKSRI
jgi:hypothetical protein